jgi:acyl dehydratase
MSNPDVIASAEQALQAVSRPLGPTEWLAVTQALVDQFADVTGDRQWIHVDPVRAAAGPFGGCIAHGLLTLSLAGGRFFHDLVRTSASRGVNYGSDKVRYPAPVRVGARVRGRAEVIEAQAIADSGVQMKVRITVDVEGESRPACVADFIARYYFEAAGNPSLVLPGK